MALDLSKISVHGDIRHLEITAFTASSDRPVHGDIRHLEKDIRYSHEYKMVHGDIRHLENTHG